MIVQAQTGEKHPTLNYILLLSEFFLLPWMVLPYSGFCTTVPIILGPVQKLCARGSNPAIITERHGELSGKPRETLEECFMLLRCTSPSVRAELSPAFLSSPLLSRTILQWNCISPPSSFSMIHFLFPMLSVAAIISNHRLRLNYIKFFKLCDFPKQRKCRFGADICLKASVYIRQQLIPHILDVVCVESTT